MLKPFYQGKLDSFCAIYAVLNGLRLTHGIRTTKAREILADTLMTLALKPELFKAVLSQKTDYINLVDGILALQCRKIPLEVIKPFAANTKVSTDEFWTECSNWLRSKEENAKGRAMIFRFMRFLHPDKEPTNRHWTTADYIEDDVLHLFDSSHEAEAVLNIKKSTIATSLKDVDNDRLMYIQPDSVRLLRLPF